MDIPQGGIFFIGRKIVQSGKRLMPQARARLNAPIDGGAVRGRQTRQIAGARAMAPPPTPASKKACRVSGKDWGRRKSPLSVYPPTRPKAIEWPTRLIRSRERAVSAVAHGRRASQAERRVKPRGEPGSFSVQPLRHALVSPERFYALSRTDTCPLTVFDHHLSGKRAAVIC